LIDACKGIDDEKYGLLIEKYKGKFYNYSGVDIILLV